VTPGGPEAARSGSFGQHHELTPVDRLGVWLSRQSIRRAVPSFAGQRVADVGCGFDARFVRSVLGEVAAATLVDISIAPDLVAHPKVSAIEAPLPDALEGIEDGRHDVTMCMSVLEHVWQHEAVLAHLRRITAPGGTVVINVPSWLGKRALELSAFRLGLSPAEEMDDHKRYYDPRDLWPLLVAAGFVPRLIRVGRHKAGLNTLAICRVPAQEPQP
jgi:2-polyprenyl-3-methyl-5-hydroxy-6-metoxy-1,4-benzoquinol methylase